MSSEKIIELSVDETNQLRAKLGLPPLRGVPKESSKSATDAKGIISGSESVLEMSVSESNALREKLGLAPLRDGTDYSRTRAGAPAAATKKEVIHAPPENLARQKEISERIEQGQLRRRVKEGISKFDASLSEETGIAAKSWAKSMRKQKGDKRTAEKTSQKVSNQDKRNLKYDEADLAGLRVAHSTRDVNEKDMVLTLADQSVLDQEDEQQLENVSLVDQYKQEKGLQEKRKVEMGAGRAGGYAGYDDDEFEELGGTMGPSRSARASALSAFPAEKTKKSRGFQIGKTLQEEELDEESELQAMKKGNAISLQSFTPDVVASDFMTAEEEELLRKKREMKFKKKKKKSKKMRQASESDEETESPLNLIRRTKDILNDLEATAQPDSQPKKRKRVDEEDGIGDLVDELDRAKQKKDKFREIMAKGTQRTEEAFKLKPLPSPEADDEEPDDDFLNAALAKARRLNRLKNLDNSNRLKGAEAVAAAVKSSSEEKKETLGNTVSFSVDETREFTRALQARSEQAERLKARQAVKKEEDASNRAESKRTERVSSVDEEDEEMEDVDMTELAKEIKEEPMTDTIIENASVSRGLGGILGMLKQTGALNRTAGREELRGRAKDERNYENYEDLNLKEVIKIDERHATEKDKEFANKQVKLEYRDKYGRLLTTKEAFRDLSYQFHGHSGGKKKEEKRQQQIAREQAEARIASEAALSGTFGALKKAQKASGKAYVVHKSS